MKIKILKGTKEEELEILESPISATSSVYKSLLGSDEIVVEKKKEGDEEKFVVKNPFGKVVVEEIIDGKKRKTTIVFVKSEIEGKENVFPIFIPDGGDAVLAVDIKRNGHDFTVKTAPSQTYKDDARERTVTATDENLARLDEVCKKFEKINGATVEARAKSESYKNLMRIYKSVTRNKTGIKSSDDSIGREFMSYIKYCIPVEVGGKPGTIIIVGEGGKDSSSRTAYYVDRVLERTTTLVDSENFATLKAQKISKIVDKGAKKAEIKCGKSSFEVEYKGTYKSIIEAMNTYIPKNGDIPALGDAYVAGREDSKPAEANYQGFDASWLCHTYAKDKNGNFVLKDGKKVITDTDYYNNCIVAGPEPRIADSDKDPYNQFVVYGASLKQFNELGLNRDEFICLLKRKNHNGYKFVKDGKGKNKTQAIVAPDGSKKDVTGIFLDGIHKVCWNEDKEMFTVIPKQKNMVVRFLKNAYNLSSYGFIDLVASVDTGLIETKDGTQKEFKKLAELAGGKEIIIDGGKIGSLKANKVVRGLQKAGQLAAIVGIALAVILPSTLVKNNSNTEEPIQPPPSIVVTEDQYFFDTTINPALGSNEAEMRKAALLAFANQSEAAIEFGITEANDSCKGVDIAGDQLIDGSFKTQLGSVIDKGIVSYEPEVNPYTFKYQVYEARKSEGLSAEETENGYQIFKYKDKSYLIDAERKPVPETRQGTISAKEITEANKEHPSYVVQYVTTEKDDAGEDVTKTTNYTFDGYLGYTLDAYFSQIGENTARSALSKKSGDSVVFPIMTIDSAGNKEVIKFREAGLEAKIKEACKYALIEDGRTDESKLDTNAEVLAQFGLKRFDDAYASYITKEYDDQKIHGSGVSDERDILASEEVQKAAMDVLKKLDISSSGVNVIPTDKDGVYYLQPTLADGRATEVLVRVEGIASLQELAKGLKNANKSVYYSAAERYKSVYSNTDSFKGVYTMRGERKDSFDSNGNLVSTYTTKAVKLIEDEEGNITFEEKDGYTVKSVGGMDDTKADIMAVYGLFSGEENKKGKANFEGRSNYTIVESEKTVETASEKAGQGK